MKRFFLVPVSLFLLLALAATAASAQWRLNAEASSIDFVTIKKSKVAELNTFGVLEGEIGEDGKASISIELASVETRIPIRNERMQKLLFEVDRFPLAVITATVDTDRLHGMAPGDSFVTSSRLTLSLHGETQPLDADLRVVKLADERLLITTVRPVIVNADAFSLGAGVEKLREVAKLPSISTAVPVTVDLVFEHRKQPR